MCNKTDIPIWQKMNLTVEEAIVYSNIGENRLRKEIADPLCPFVLNVGNSKKLIKRKEFEEWNSKIEFI